MFFSIPIEIGFEVLNEFMKRNIPYSKHTSDEEPDDFVIDVDIHDDYVKEAEEIVNRVVERYNLKPKSS